MNYPVKKASNNYLTSNFMESSHHSNNLDIVIFSTKTIKKHSKKRGEVGWVEVEQNPMTSNLTLGIGLPWSDEFDNKIFSRA